MRIREYLISSQYELEQYVDILHPPNGLLFFQATTWLDR